VTRRSTILRENPGPRAVMDAFERLSGGYEGEITAIRAGIALKEGQLRDYEGRIGKAFGHADYKSQLSHLRDQLKLGLSERPPEDGTPVAELAERIAALRAASTVEAAPVRAGTQKATRAERPVTARIRERLAVEAMQAEPEIAGQAASANFGTISVKHSGGRDFENRIIDATRQIVEETPKAFATVERWKQIILPRPAQVEMARRAFDLKPLEVVRPAALLTARREEDYTDADGNRDLWRTFNCLQGRRPPCGRDLLQVGGLPCMKGRVMQVVDPSVDPAAELRPWTTSLASAA
jgi:hypothetical protein